MEPGPRIGRGQLGLFPGESEREELKLPEEITAEVVEALGGLLLEAAGVPTGPREGEGDESEDRA